MSYITLIKHPGANNSFCIIINRGAFSDVYLVKERKTGKMFAMKCLNMLHLCDVTTKSTHSYIFHTTCVRHIEL